MGTTRRVVAVAALAGLMFAFAPAALWADKAITPGANFFGIDPGASGTTVAGQLAIYYVVTAQSGCEGEPTFRTVDMYYVMRLKKGTETFAFAPAGPFSVCYENTDDQADEIKRFIKRTVAPAFFPGFQSPPNDVAVKSVTDFHTDGDPASNTFCTTPSGGSETCPAFWAFMNIVLAVK